MDAYDAFFRSRRSDSATNVANKVNDTYLKANGQTEGIASYGLVVDLSVNYLEEHYDSYGLQN